VDQLNRAVGPFGLYLPVLTILKNYTKKRGLRRHAITTTHMMSEHLLANRAMRSFDEEKL
jgi:hypothetical protein